jgi:hypothetical protein
MQTRELELRSRRTQTIGVILATQTTKGTLSNETPSRNSNIGESNRPITRPEPAVGPSTVAGPPQGEMQGEKEVTGVVHLETTPKTLVEKETGGGMVSTETGAEDLSEVVTQAGAPSAEVLSAEVLLVGAAEVLLEEVVEVHREEVHLEADRRDADQGDHQTPSGEAEDEGAEGLRSDRALRTGTAVCSDLIHSKRTTTMMSAAGGAGTLWCIAREGNDCQVTPHPDSMARA